MLVVGDDRVEVAEQQDAARAGAGDPGAEVGRVVRAGAREVLDLRAVREQAGDDRLRLLRARDVTRRGRDADERLELGERAVGDRD